MRVSEIGKDPLAELILLRKGFALRPLGEPLPKLPAADGWRNEVDFELWVQYHGSSLEVQSRS